MLNSVKIVLEIFVVYGNSFFLIYLRLICRCLSKLEKLSEEYSRMKIPQILQQLFKQKQMEQQNVICLICQNINCYQSNDHQRITKMQFDILFMRNSKNNIFISDIKNKVKKVFAQFSKQFHLDLKQEEYYVQLLMDKLKYWHFLECIHSLKSIQALLFGRKLSRHQVRETIKALRTNYKKNLIFPSFRTLQKQIKNIFSCPLFLSNLSSIDRYKYIIDKVQSIITHFQQKENPVEKAHPVEYQYYQCEKDAREYIHIEGVPMNASRLSLNLSMLQMNDNSIMKYCSAFEKMTYLQQLQLRNNNITFSGYRILFNIFSSTLKCLDIRNSRLNSLSIQLLCKKMTKIEKLYVSETQLNDMLALEILIALPNLKLFYADTNYLTYDGCIKLFIMSTKLYFVSLRNNKITKEQAIALKNLAKIKNCQLQI